MFTLRETIAAAAIVGILLTLVGKEGKQCADHARESVERSMKFAAQERRFAEIEANE